MGEKQRGIIARPNAEYVNYFTIAAWRRIDEAKSELFRAVLTPSSNR
jgi:hypothetical protein